MNIDQYRAIKAQTEQPATHTPEQTQEQATQVTPTQPETKPEEKPTLPEKITIDGIGEVTLDELKNGYLRQSDYTKKTQEIANKRKETEEAIKLYESLQQNPQIIQQLKQIVNVPPSLDPITSEIVKLRNELYDLKLEKEISDLQAKYPDFEVRQVLEIAREKQLPNLEDAYHLFKSQKAQPLDENKFKEQLRQQILNELKAEQSATSTIISTNSGAPIISDNQPKVSEAEAKVARNMKMSVAEYVKWRDAGKKR